MKYIKHLFNFLKFQIPNYNPPPPLPSPSKPTKTPYEEYMERLVSRPQEDIITNSNPPSTSSHVSGMLNLFTLHPWEMQTGHPLDLRQNSVNSQLKLLCKTINILCFLFIFAKFANIDKSTKLNVSTNKCQFFQDLEHLVF